MVKKYQWSPIWKTAEELNMNRESVKLILVKDRQEEILNKMVPHKISGKNNVRE
jgi:hypothetical protein